MTARGPLDATLDALVGDARDELAAAIDAELEVVAPDFAAIVEELARRGEAVADEVPALRPAWGAEPPTRGAADDPLAALLGEARQEIEADVAARRLLPLPDAPTPAPSPAAAIEAPPRRLRWLGAALMIAAAVLLIWGLEPLLARPLSQGAAPSAAQWSEEGAAEGGRASARDDAEDAPAGKARRRGSPVRSDLQEVAADDDQENAAALDADAAAAAPESAPKPAPEAEPAAPAELVDGEHPAEPPARRRRPTLDELEAEAEALWRAGDRVGAEATLRTIIRRAGDGRRADLAYGDLFTITRQLHGREREAAVWREYVARFPRGRYADDARAGLCRREAGASAAACWRRYQGDFPAGTHTDEAARATASEAPEGP
ncbi:MAG: hypothetical protein R3A79_23245 [Nannocystaceae bacterium]